MPAAVAFRPVKLAPFILPIVCFVVVGVWLAGQRTSLTALLEKNAALGRRIGESHKSSPPDFRAGTASGKNAKSSEAPDWEKIAAQMEEMSRGGGDMRLLARLEDTLVSMSPEELATSLEEVLALKMSRLTRQMLEMRILHPLMEKDPELALDRFIGRRDEPHSSISWQLPSAMKKWAEKDPAKAQAWFDQRVAAGTFDGKSLDGEDSIRTSFEGPLIGVMIGVDVKAAEKRIAALPESERIALLENASIDSVPPDRQRTYADFLRQHLPELVRTELIAGIGSQLIRGGEEIAAVEVYLDRISATPAERSASVEESVIARVEQVAAAGDLGRDEVDSLRRWISRQSPDAVDQVTGKALGEAVRGDRNLKYGDAAALAQEYAKAGGNQDVLFYFLKANSASSHAAEARELARKITDEARRQEILQSLR